MQPMPSHFGDRVVAAVVGPLVGPATCTVILLAVLPLVIGPRSRRWWLGTSFGILLASLVSLIYCGQRFVLVQSGRPWLFLLLWSALVVIGAAAGPVLIRQRASVFARVMLLVVTLVGSVIGGVAGVATAWAVGCSPGVACYFRIRAGPGERSIWDGQV